VKAASLPEGNVLWKPSAERVSAARLTHFTRQLRDQYHQTFPDYRSLWRWSIANKAVFWETLWDHCGIVGDRGARALVDGHLMPGARWFPDAALNFAENFLQHRGESDALVYWNEAGARTRVSWDQLHSAVGRVQQALMKAGVRSGDVVASLLPNCPEAAIAMLATASLGAIWSSTSPDFGAQGVLDRFTQISPKVLLAVDAYFYNGKWVDTTERVAQIVGQLPSVQSLVVVTDVMRSASEAWQIPIADRVIFSWRNFLGDEPVSPVFSRFPFDHPLFIVFSSGTTGLPKCIIHGAGGTLLQLVKEHALHGDHRAGDRVFYFSTTGWVMWNWLLAGLTQGATCLLYDGSPFANDGKVLFDFAATERATQFGVGAKYIDAIKKLGLEPKQSHDLSALRTVYSTGSPLSPESFDYVYERIKADVHLASISGGTDIMSCFAIGNPTLPVRRGEMQCRGLGMAVDVWDDDGQALAGDMGELVCSQTFPSMPLGFVNDPEGIRYRAAYFERFPGVWTHGDWCRITPSDGVQIFGRSDATLNPGGVRIGTAEIYRQVETIDEVVESIAIGQQFNHDARVVLFVKLRDGLLLDDALIERIKQRIKAHTTPRHVPAKVLQVLDIPRTKSNKIVELAVRDVVHGRNVKNRDALANPEALAYFRDRVELLS
jgi:acetoacetyl-CoA synthetase